MSSDKLAIVVLAAGQGKRMLSDLPKVLHPVLGEPMIGHVLRQCEALNPARVVVVTGHGRAEVEAWIANQSFSCPLEFVEQVSPRGTGHAMQCAMGLLEGCDEVLVLYGDVPLLRPSTLSSLLDRGPVVLAFHRGHWCPYCRLNMVGLAEIQHQAKPVQIVAISTEIQQYTQMLRAEAGAEHDAGEL